MGRQEEVTSYHPNCRKNCLALSLVLRGIPFLVADAGLLRNSFQQFHIIDRLPVGIRDSEFLPASNHEGVSAHLNRTGKPEPSQFAEKFSVFDRSGRHLGQCFRFYTVQADTVDNRNIRVIIPELQNQPLFEHLL